MPVCLLGRERVRSFSRWSHRRRPEAVGASVGGTAGNQFAYTGDEGGGKTGTRQVVGQKERR